jgi:hypothetical protein
MVRLPRQPRPSSIPVIWASVGAGDRRRAGWAQRVHPLLGRVGFGWPGRGGRPAAAGDTTGTGGGQAITGWGGRRGRGRWPGRGWRPGRGGYRGAGAARSAAGSGHRDQHHPAGEPRRYQSGSDQGNRQPPAESAGAGHRGQHSQQETSHHGQSPGDGQHLAGPPDPGAHRPHAHRPHSGTPVPAAATALAEGLPPGAPSG